MKLKLILSIPNFAELRGENDEAFNQLLLHIDVRWLSRYDSLQRLVELYGLSDEFLMNVNPSLCDELRQCRNNLFCLPHLYSKFNVVQKLLQGEKC